MDKRSETTNCNEPCSAFFLDAIISNLNLIAKNAPMTCRPNYNYACTYVHIQSKVNTIREFRAF